MVDSKIAEEFNSIQRLLKIIDVQYFDLREVKSNNVNEKPEKIRFALMLAKFVLIIVLLGINMNDFEKRTAIGSSLISFLKSFYEICFIFLLTSCIVQPYIATRKIKKIYMNFSEILNLLDECFSIKFDFISFRRRFFKRFIFIYSVFLSSFVISDDIFKTLQFYLIFTLYPLSLILFFIISYIFFVDLFNQLLNLLIATLKKIFREKANEKCSEKKIFELTICRQIFNKIIDCGLILNESFGFVMLLVFIIWIMTMTLIGYKLFVSTIDKREGETFYGKLN